ncbi:hypothetical protein [Amycolatopsis sp. WQ 127309]|uniref:hypothetical protein n=1 Tax=Amycolatopsis sp. WQ 127309 TaxID=2932773 RepID=UPI001FF1B8B3|nr:hypothetical protein [Amycolatopsis sp. WQ 127309]UOZ04148.1 hypothetical protein MUY22_35650 [Amycolatopsis sp. WQ 127309]
MTGVLVAQQRTGDQGLPVAAEHLVGLLRSWGPDQLRGLALAGISVPSRAGPRFIDALVFTRSGVVVLAAHEPGVVTGAEPGPQVGVAVAAVKGALGALGGGEYVTGLVVVVPPARQLDSPWAATEAAADVEPRRPELVAPGHGAFPGERTLPAPPPPAGLPGIRHAWPLLPMHEPEAGVATVLADPRGLRRIIAQHNRWRTVWTADDVLEACYALSLAHLAPPRAALLAERFPLRLPTAARVLQPVPELREVAAEVVEPPEPAVEEPAPLRPRGPVSAVFPRQRPIRQVPWGLVVVLSLLVTIGLVAAVFVAQVFHGG